jgi:hypothetical protein
MDMKFAMKTLDKWEMQGTFVSTTPALRLSFPSADS